MNFAKSPAPVVCLLGFIGLIYIVIAEGFNPTMPRPESEYENT